MLSLAQDNQTFSQVSTPISCPYCKRQKQRIGEKDRRWWNTWAKSPNLSDVQRSFLHKVSLIRMTQISPSSENCSSSAPYIPQVRQRTTFSQRPLTYLTFQLSPFSCCFVSGPNRKTFSERHRKKIFYEATTNRVDGFPLPDLNPRSISETTFAKTNMKFLTI